MHGTLSSIRSPSWVPFLRFQMGMKKEVSVARRWRACGEGELLNRVLRCSSFPLRTPPLLFPLVLSGSPFSMAAKEEKLQTTYLEHHSKSTHASFDSLTPPTLTPEEEAKVWRKIDMRLIPILALLYLFSFLDRGMLRWFLVSVWHGSHPPAQGTLVRTLPPPPSPLVRRG